MTLKLPKTNKKKNATKKTRRGINDECAALEREVHERQARELAALAGDGPAGGEEAAEGGNNDDNGEDDDRAANGVPAPPAQDAADAADEEPDEAA